MSCRECDLCRARGTHHKPYRVGGRLVLEACPMCFGWKYLYNGSDMPVKDKEAA